jgi:hypothetical protein
MPAVPVPTRSFVALFCVCRVYIPAAVRDGEEMNEPFHEKPHLEVNPIHHTTHQLSLAVAFS